MWWKSLVVRSDIYFIPSVTGSVKGNVRGKITEGKDKEVWQGWYSEMQINKNGQWGGQK